ncbi:MAG: DUF4270 family protein [Rikenellaceae bacterium]
MINYSCKTLASVCLVALSAVVLLFSSCTQVDDTLGNNLVPNNQQMAVGTVSFENSVTTASYFTDSIASSNVGVFLLGKQTSPTFGIAKAGFFAQYAPYYNSYTDGDTSAPFGLDPVVDSVILTVPIYVAYSDDTLTEQTIDIYMVKENMIEIDSTYYTNFDYKDYLEDQPLTSFTFSGTYYEGLEIKLPDSFGEMLFDASDDAYEADSLFIDKFPGFVFMPQDASPEQAAIYAIMAEYTSTTVYYRNMDSDGEVADTLYSIYTFDDSSTSYCVSINLMEHDYSSTTIDISEGGNTNEDVTYVQGLGGVVTSLTFGEDILEELASKVGPDTDYTDISISKAVLYFYTSIKDHDYNENLPSRLGIFTDYVNRSPIVDYSYVYEEDYGVSIPYGGYFEGSLFEYSMDITTYLSQLYAGNEDSPQTVIMGTEYSTQLMFQEAILAGSASDTPPRLEVTYTLIK